MVFVDGGCCPGVTKNNVGYIVGIPKNNNLDSLQIALVV